MILTDISTLIVIDEIVLNDSQNYIHFVTHIDKLLNVPKDWKSVIYTSTHIFKFLWLKQNAIDQKYFRVLPKNSPCKITLSDGIEIELTMFEISEITGNVAFHFKESNKNILYVGPFTRCNQLLLNDHFYKYVKNGIDFLYLDNTRTRCSVEASTRDVLREIISILNKNPGYKILLSLPEYGNEELILALLEYDFKICVGSLQTEIFRKFREPYQFETDTNNADIIIGNDVRTIDEIEVRLKKYKRLTVRVINCDTQLYNYSMKSIGLYVINWSTHPSFKQLYHLISFITPQYIYEIHNNMPKFPTELHDLCIRKRVCEDNQREQQQLNDNEYNNNANNINLIKNDNTAINDRNYCIQIINNNDNEYITSSSASSSPLSIYELFKDDNFSSTSSFSEEEFAESIQQKNKNTISSSASSSPLSINGLFKDDNFSSISSFSDEKSSNTTRKRSLNSSGKKANYKKMNKNKNKNLKK